MKKVLIVLSLVIAIMLASCGYSKSALIEAKNEAYREGFEDGYDKAEYESRGKIEEIRSQFEWEIEGIKEEYSYYMDSAYDAGYEEGYGDCLVDHGLSTEDYHGSAWIKKDK